MPCDFDLCEDCFQARDDHDDWEEPFVDAVEANGSTSMTSPEYVHLQPCFGRRVYADTTDLTFETIPESLAGDRITFIRTVGVDCASTLPDALTFSSVKPIRVYLGFRDDQKLPDWLDTSYLSTPYHVLVRSPLQQITYNMFESKAIYVPNDDADEVTVTIAGAQCAQPSGSFSPSSRDFRNYIVFIEELDDDDVTEYNAQLFEAAAAASAVDGQAAQGFTFVSTPKPKQTWLRGGAWSLFRALMSLAVSPPDATITGTAAAPLAANGGAGKASQGPLQAATPAFNAKYTDELYKVAFNIVKNELVIGGNALLDVDQGTASLEALEVESLLHAQLQFLTLLSTSSNAKPYIASPDVMKALMRIYKGGSPRLQRAVLTILCAVASRLEPRSIDGVVRSVWQPTTVHRWSSLDENQNSFLGMLFETAALPALLACEIEVDWYDVKRADGPDALSAVTGHGAGAVLQGLSCDAVTLLRTLVTLSGWHGVLASQLEQALQEAGMLVGGAASGSASPVALTPGDEDTTATLHTADSKEDTPDAELLTRVFAAFGVLGGQFERLRVGGGVQHASGSGGVGKVVQFQYGSSLVPLRVSYASGAVTAASTVLHTVARSTVIACAVVPPPLKQLPLSPDTLASFRGLLDCAHTLTAQSPLWKQHLCHATVTVVSVLLEDGRLLGGARDAGLLPALYSIALTPKPFAWFVEHSDVTQQLIELQARLVEAKQASLQSPDVTIASVLPRGYFSSKAAVTHLIVDRDAAVAGDGGVSESKGVEVESDVKTAEGVATGEPGTDVHGPHWRSALAVAEETGFSPVAACKALDMFNGDTAAAKTWLTDSASMWSFVPAIGTFEGSVTPPDASPTQVWKVLVAPGTTGSGSGGSLVVVATLTRTSAGVPSPAVDKYSGAYDPTTRTVTLTLVKSLPASAPGTSPFDTTAPIPKLELFVGC